jgi:hypothetical protein
MYLLAAVLGVIALLALGAMADSLLRTLRPLTCAAPPGATTKQEALSDAIDVGPVGGVHVGNSSTAI